jgi:hypothetical protein
MSDGIGNSGTIVWQLALCLLMAWLIVFSVLIKGIASLGKVIASTWCKRLKAFSDYYVLSFCIEPVFMLCQDSSYC